MDERNEDGKVEMPANKFVSRDFSVGFELAFSGKDETIRIMDPRFLKYSCKACFPEYIDRCEGCVNQKETDKLNAWKTCVKESKVLRSYIMGIEGIEDIILGFCGWEEGIWRWLGESIDGRWREQSLEFWRAGIRRDDENCPFETCPARNLLENMCKFAEKIFRPHDFALNQIHKEQKSSDLCLGKQDFQRVCETTLRDRERAEGMNFTEEAMHALQVASESMICQKFKDGVLRASVRKGMVESSDFSSELL